MTQRFHLAVVIAAWLSLAAILYATIIPIGLRPQDALPVDVDRALAFAVMAGLFVVAYPRQWKTVAILVVLGAGLIEAAQYLSPSRHPRFDNALVKAVGAAAGIVAGFAANLVFRPTR